MSDLISRNRAISILEQLDEHSLSGKMDISNAIYLLENQPAAYDIDNVVEKLKKRNQEYLDSFALHERDELYGVACGLADAIEIVKQCSVSDDVCEWKYNDTEYYWESSCEHLHIFMADGPKENEYIFCPYCGKKIKVVE